MSQCLPSEMPNFSSQLNDAHEKMVIGTNDNKMKNK
jgi:hypothetical protein